MILLVGGESSKRRFSFRIYPMLLQYYPYPRRVRSRRSLEALNVCQFTSEMLARAFIKGYFFCIVILEGYMKAGADTLTNFINFTRPGRVAE